MAVKLLKKSKGNAEEFMNENDTVGRTNHVNIVKLAGFCFEGHKKAPVYEFMPNGSLDNKFIHHEKRNERSLALRDLFQISVGLARGLEYMHRGCNTRILHFDIKPHNILLDEKSGPKISEFGLTKTCALRESIMSMSVGTIGYIAPEVFLKQYGGVSHKSDVYSYGMLVLEMLGWREKGDIQVDCCSEQYFPEWIYKQLDGEKDLCDDENINDGERKIQRKMVLVSLWCIRIHPSSRPTMSRVVEMLEGSLESLQIPPMPLLTSPSRPPQDSSTALSVSSSATQLLSIELVKEDSSEIELYTNSP